MRILISIALIIKRIAFCIFRLIEKEQKKKALCQPALYINSTGSLKLRPDISAKLHQTPMTYIVETACIMHYYKEGIHLDIGCGSRKITASAIGVDINDDPSQFLAGTVNIITQADDLHCFSDGAVDFISSIHSFEHYANPREVLLEWYRVLKIGGRICIVVPDKDGVIPDKEILKDHKHDYDTKALEDMVHEFGNCFKILAINTLQNGWSIDLIIEKIC